MKQSIRSFFLLFCFGIFISGGLLAQPAITLLSNIAVQDSNATDVWGYVDNNTGTEYALVGSWGAVSIIDVSDAANPQYAKFIDTVPGFDIKTWGTYMYAVDGGSGGQGHIIDLSDPENPVHVGRFPNHHNIWIDDQGYLYGAYQGLSVYDLNVTPTNPQLVWQDTSASGHDVIVEDDRMYWYTGFQGLWIYDISNRTSPSLLAQIQDPNIVYAHSGHVTPDRSHVTICDELAGHPTDDISVWNISDINNPQRVADYADPDAIVHNMFIIGSYAFTSYYMNGFRIFDISTPSAFNLVANFVTFPDTSFEGFDGAFGVYPYAPSGNIYISDMTYGLYVLGVDTTITAVEAPLEAVSTLEIFPNPVAGRSTFRFELEKGSAYSLDILDQQGRLVDHVADGHARPGQHAFEWERSRLDGLADGLYHLRLTTDASSVQKSLLLTR